MTNPILRLLQRLRPQKQHAKTPYEIALKAGSAGQEPNGLTAFFIQQLSKRKDISGYGHEKGGFYIAGDAAVTMTEEEAKDIQDAVDYQYGYIAGIAKFLREHGYSDEEIKSLCPESPSFLDISKGIRGDPIDFSRRYSSEKKYFSESFEREFLQKKSGYQLGFAVRAAKHKIKVSPDQIPPDQRAFTAFERGLTGQNRLTPFAFAPHILPEEEKLKYEQIDNNAYDLGRRFI